MNKNNFYYAVIIIIALVIALFSFISTFFTENQEAYTWLDRGLWVAEFSGFLMLLLNGTFIRSKYFKYLLAVIPFYGLGILFKILHWEFEIITGNLVLLLASLAIIIFYSLSFIKKLKKGRLDYFKLAWVISRFIFGILILLRFIDTNFSIIPSIFMWLAILDYCIMEYRAKRLFQ